MKSYTTRDAARLLRLSEAQVRSQARAGFLTPDRGPRNSYRFSFQDPVLLRTARELVGARVPPRRIKGALCKLARDLPKGRSPSGLRITADAHQVIVLEGGNAWNPESEQLHIDFAVAELAVRTAPVARRIARSAVRASEPLGAAEWFDLGADLEEAAPDEARGAYARALALELEREFADAHFNLARLCEQAGRQEAAVSHLREYQKLSECEPS